MTSTQELETHKQRIHATFSKADAALHNGRISEAERNALLTSYYGTSDERTAVAAIERELEYQRLSTGHDGINKATLLIIGFSLFVATLFVTLFFTTGGITGAVVREHEVNTTYFTNATVQLELNAATRVNITGTAQGDGEVIITLVENGERHAMYSWHRGVQTQHASIPRSRYVQGEPVTFTATAVSSAYLMTGSQAIPLDLGSTTLENLSVGEYTIKLIINDTSSTNANRTGADEENASLSQEALSFSVVAPGTPAPAESFNTCGSLCDANITANATLEISITGNTTAWIGEIIISTSGNRAPQLIHTIPDMTGEGSVRLDVSSAFSDPDGDQLYFDSSRHEEMAESLQNGIFTVSGAPGTYTYIIYASDLHELAPSNIFSITILAPNDTATGIAQNATAGANASENTTNSSAASASAQSGNNPALSNMTSITANNTNITTNAANATTSTVAGSAAAQNLTYNGTQQGDSTAPQDNSGAAEDCSSPDPNLRPLSCIQGNDSTYFKPEIIMLENKNAVAVGQLTPVGNLLIRGGLVEGSAGQPAAGDYALGYTNENGDFIATVWIDTASGDLHLAGHLTEANGNIHVEEGWSAVANRRGIVLALINRQTGDLVVRGNLIPYRRSLG
jgi:hypothetical protein